MTDFVEELNWRGMLHNYIPGTEELLKKEMTTAYIGFDPTSDSLHVGSLAQIMTLRHFQKAGHKPLVLVGGATGMIGDPSGKSEERNLLNEETLAFNLAGIRKQLEKFLDFDPSLPNCAEVVNNYDWTKDYTFLDFIRDIGKHITVNYMMAKDSVKKRINAEDDGTNATGMSFTEFSYQLVQGFDFLWLYENKHCKLQMGGSDQWGNITTGTELIKRKLSGKAYALTTQLITKEDGGKFGKSEKGNVWIDASKTTPYEFYQFWLKVSDTDAKKYIRIFTELSKDEVEKLIAEHELAPDTRLLQKTIAKEVTVLVHSLEEYNTAIEASAILFGKSTRQAIENMSDSTIESVFSGVPVFNIQPAAEPWNILDLLTSVAPVFASKGELRRMITENGLSINQEKWTKADGVVSASDFIRNKYLIVSKGKKQHFLLKISN